MTRFTWRPVDGDAVEVQLFCRRDEPVIVCRADDPAVRNYGDRQLGTVFETPGRGWHFCRHGVLETRGSQLCNRDAAVSALLFALRQEGKV